LKRAETKKAIDDWLPVINSGCKNRYHVEKLLSREIFTLNRIEFRRFSIKKNGQQRVERCWPFSGGRRSPPKSRTDREKKSRPMRHHIWVLQLFKI